MATIAPTPLALGHTTLRSHTAQASTGQTDWVSFQPNARYASIYLSLTDVGASTTPILTPSLLVADPAALVDTNLINLGEHAAFTGITAAAQYIIDIGPGITGIANDVTNSATADSYISLNVVLPSILGIKILNDRTTGDEVYTYNLSISVRP
jgi:hypothetical protein